MLVGAVATLWLAATGKLTLYIHPRYTVFTVVMASAAVILVLAAFAVLPGRREDDHHHHDHDHDAHPSQPDAGLIIRCAAHHGGARPSGRTAGDAQPTQVAESRHRQCRSTARHR